MARVGRDITEAELEVLTVLWRLGRGAVRDVREEMERKGRRLAHTTVLTLFERLEKKGYVGCNRSGLANIYKPLVSRGKVTRDRLGALVEQLGEGEAAPLILQLVRAHRLSAEDIRQLRKLLIDLEADAKKRKKP